MAKAKISYTVRTTRAPGETKDTIVPVIVERLAPVDLETVVENCIDRGLIAGIKPTAAHGIAEGVAAQLAREFTLGHGVMFGQFFYGRPYLSGVVDSNGLVGSGNSINVRLYKGAAFKLTRDDFAFSFDGAGDAVRVDSVFGDSSDAGGNTYGQVLPNMPVVINGRNLYAAGDINKVTFTPVDGGEAVEVTEFRAQGDGILSFAWPTALVAGKAYNVVVSRTDVNDVTRTSAAKRVTVVGSAPRPTATSWVADEMDGEPINLGSSSVTVNGTKLAGATKVQFMYSEDGAVFCSADVGEATDTSVTAQCGYTGTPTQAEGFLRVVTPNGTTNSIPCTFSR